MRYSTGIKRLSNAARGQKDRCVNRPKNISHSRGRAMAHSGTSLGAEA